jgi:hypothetical protein
MAYSITQFENNLTNPLAGLDNNFTTFGALVPIPCGMSGTNALVLTQNAVGVVPTPTISGYSSLMLFTGIAAGTNSTSVTATVGSTGVLNVYKDTAAGPALLTGNEIVTGCAFSLQYDAALNSGAGGFHLISSTATANNPIVASSVQVGGSTLTNFASGSSPTLTFTATPGWSSQDQTFSVSTIFGNGSVLPNLGDFMQVNPPSLGAAGVDYRAYVTGVGSVSLVTLPSISVSTINIRLMNAASASLASNSGVYRWAATRLVP